MYEGLKRWYPERKYDFWYNLCYEVMLTDTKSDVTLMIKEHADMLVERFSDI